MFNIFKKFRPQNDNKAKRKMFLHVGLHKTGTTAIQDFLFLNRESLLTQGFLYPITEFHPLGQQRVAYAFNGEVNPHLNRSKVNQNDELFNKLSELINQDNYQTLIVSSENFTPAGNRTALRKIRNFFDDFEINVIFYLRRQDKYKESLYREHIKLPNSEVSSFENFKVPYLLDYEKRLKPWMSVFGEENLIVRSYDYLVGNGIDVIDDFCHIVGLDVNNYEKPKKKSNSTISNIAMELIRALNNVDVEHNDRGKINIAIRKFCEDSAFKQVWGFSTQSQQMLEKFSESNIRVSSKFFEGVPMFDQKTLSYSSEHIIDRQELIEMFESYFSKNKRWPETSLSLGDAINCITQKLDIQYPV